MLVAVQESIAWVQKQPAIRNTVGRSWVPRVSREPRVPAWAGHVMKAVESDYEDQESHSNSAETEGAALQVIFSMLFCLTV